jgi:hypothetical protein
MVYRRESSQLADSWCVDPARPVSMEAENVLTSRSPQHAANIGQPEPQTETRSGLPLSMRTGSEPGATAIGVEQQRPIVEVIVNVRREARRYPCCPISAAPVADPTRDGVAAYARGPRVPVAGTTLLHLGGGSNAVARPPTVPSMTRPRWTSASSRAGGVRLSNQLARSGGAAASPRRATLRSTRCPCQGPSTCLPPAPPRLLPPYTMGHIGTDAEPRERQTRRACHCVLLINA